MANTTKTQYQSDVVNMLNRGYPNGTMATMIADYTWDLFVTIAGAAPTDANRTTAATDSPFKTELTGQ